ncbi:hypothetical protein Cme02nite_05360 [Catellatospora methionotrophica]|uniref:Uncharacterized protein n=1 Tax=Catellatospora methionotrophica TaxID=121620 RepID=A0A8J3LAP0_9ACTN|nr:hypothetical protein [Catellatospora methionotrophica]GIG12204.1 hypothetical protein Cme02nite_05360 [Catellatospora methionotrophica]
MQEHSQGGDTEVVPSADRPRRGLWAALALVAVLAVGGGAVAWVSSGDDGQTPLATAPAAFNTADVSASPSPSVQPSVSPSALPSPSVKPSVKPTPSRSPSKAAVKITLRVPASLEGIAKAPGTGGPLPDDIKQHYPQAKWVSGAYGDEEEVAGKKLAFYAATSSRLGTPASEVQWLSQRMGEDGFTGFATVPAGWLGGAAKCGHQQILGSVFVCIWADSGSIGMIMLWDYDQSEAKSAFLRVRAQIERRG